MFLDRLLAPAEGSRYQVAPSVHPSEWTFKFGEDLGVGSPSISGVDDYDLGVAFNFSASWAATRALAEPVAQIPLVVYQRRGLRGRDRRRAVEHELYELLHDEVSEEQSSFHWRETGMSHLLWWGNEYAELDPHPKTGRMRSIRARRPERVVPERHPKTGRLQYRIKPPSKATRQTTDKIIPRERMLHIAGLGWNGLVGMSVLDVARASISHAIATERFGQQFFGRGGKMFGFLKHPKRLGDIAFGRLRESLNDPRKDHTWFIAEEGMEPFPIGIPPETAQFLQSRTFNVLEICRWFKVPPHMLAELSRATFSNIEHQSIAFVTNSLVPWLRRWESELNRKLLTKEERRSGLFIEFLVTGLLRGDTKARYEAYKVGLEHGWLSQNDIRELENLHSIPDGDHYWMPLNFQPIEQVLEPPELPVGLNDDVDQVDDEAEEDPEDDAGDENEGDEDKEDRQAAGVERRRLEQRQGGLDARWRLQRTFLKLLEQNASRMMAAEIKAIRRAVELMPTHGIPSFRVWLESFYTDHRDFVDRLMAPILEAYMREVAAQALLEVGGDLDAFDPELERFHRDYVDAFVRRHTAGNRGQLLALLEEAAEQMEEAQRLLNGRLDEWETKSAGKIARVESTRSLNAVAKAAWTFAGVSVIVWQANRDACELCLALHGTEVEVSQHFLKPDDVVVVEDPETNDLVVRTVIGHPPLHGGCVCGIAPQ